MSPPGKSLAQTLGSRFALMVSGRVTLLLVSLLATALLTRFLGPEGFGHFRTAVAYLAFAISLADLGLGSLFVREISRPGADQARLIANALGLRLVLAGLAMAAAVLLAFVLPLDHEDRLGILGGSFGFLAYSVHLLLFGLFQQKLRQGGVVLAELSGGVLLLLLILLFARLGAAPWWFAMAMGLSYMLTLAVTLVAAGRLVDLGLKVEPHVWWQYVKDGAPIAAATIMSVIYIRADTILLAILQTPEEVGLYGVPIKIFDSFLGMTLLLVGLFAPLLAWTARSDQAEFRTHLGNGLAVLAVGTAGIAVGTVAIAPEIVRLFAGPAFEDSVPILRIIAALLVLRSLTLILREATTALDLQRRLIPAFAIAGVVAFTAYFLLIPPLGGIGAALALLAGETILLVYVASVVIRATATKALARVPLRAGLSAIGAALVALWLDWQGYGFLWRGVLASAVYLGLLLATRALTLPELRSLGRELLAKRGARAPAP